jgi:hypothetical protein
MTTLETANDNVPKLIMGWRRHEEAFENFKDEIKSKFESTGCIVKQGQPSNADIEYEGLKQDQSKIISHLIITFENKPGWIIDVYHAGCYGLSTYFVCRAFKPDVKIYYTWEMSGLEWDEWLGYLDHCAYLEERQERGILCDCIDCDKEGNDGAIIETIFRQDDQTLIKQAQPTIDSLLSVSRMGEH